MAIVVDEHARGPVRLSPAIPQEHEEAATLAAETEIPCPRFTGYGDLAQSNPHVRPKKLSQDIGGHPIHRVKSPQSPP